MCPSLDAVRNQQRGMSFADGLQPALNASLSFSSIVLASAFRADIIHSRFAGARRSPVSCELPPPHNYFGSFCYALPPCPAP